jgi:Holliday junction DNA helicase RuvA
MIAHLRGTLLEKHPNQAVVECAGVGYDVTISVSTFSSLPDLGEQALLRIHTHVREDAFQLFGFSTPEEKSLFEKLITVSGIGPKLAITALSGLAATDLIRIIRAGEVQQLTRLPGIGKKTAERIVLELRDKLDFGPAGTSISATTKPSSAGQLTPLEQDCISALTNLGAQPGPAELAVRKALGELGDSNFEAVFRRSLELLR